MGNLSSDNRELRLVLLQGTAPSFSGFLLEYVRSLHFLAGSESLLGAALIYVTAEQTENFSTTRR